MWSTAEYGWEGVGGKCVGEMGGDSGVVVWMWVCGCGCVDVGVFMRERRGGYGEFLRRIEG